MPITDLTGTKWVLNTNASFNSLVTYHINFTSNSQQYISMQCTGGLRSGSIYYWKDENTYDEVAYNDGDIGGWTVTSWINEAYRTIEITGGTDVTNSTLISWLQANATQIIEPTANTYTITHNLTNLTKGNITLTITPDVGYELPDTITVTNGTLVSYDKTTGVVVVSGDDNTSVSCECVASVPSGYSVTFSTISVQYKDASSGGFYVLVNDSDFTTGGFHYDYVLEAEDYGTGVWYDSNGNIISIPFVVNDVSSLSFLSRGNGFTISLDGVQVVNQPSYGETIYTVDITSDCTLTGTAYRTD